MSTWCIQVVIFQNKTISQGHLLNLYKRQRLKVQHLSFGALSHFRHPLIIPQTLAQNEMKGKKCKFDEMFDEKHLCYTDQRNFILTKRTFE